MADLATVGFVADTSGLMKAEKGLDNLSKQGAKTDKAMSGAGASIGKSFAGIAAAVGGLVSATSVMQKLIETSREFDVLNAGLITATGSAEKASVAFKAIEDFATTTPYSLGQATKAFTQLVNLGLTPSEKALTSYGNTAAAMGKDLSQMVEAVADATVGEFERLKEFGIKSRVEGDNVSFTFRGMTTTVKKSAEEIEGYLIGLGQNEFASAMANRMNTLDGAISNLSDSWDGLFRTISSQGAGDLITSGVRMATEAISELTDMIASGQLGAYLDAIAGKFKSWGADIAVILDAIGQLFADAGEYWYLDMSESSRLMTDAFKNMPENIRALIQITTIEIASFVDKVTVYANAIAASLTFTEQTRSVEESIASINSVRESSIASIMNERDAALQSFESQITLADGLRLKYDQLSASTGGATDRLAEFGVNADDSSRSAEAASEAAEKLAKQLEAVARANEAWEVDEYDRIEKALEDMEQASIEAQEAEMERIDKAIEQIDKYVGVSEKAAERIESAFADVWMNAFDGFESVVDGMKNAFKRMLAEMAHMALTKPIMISLGMGGLLPGAASAAGTAAGVGGIGAAAGGLGLLGSIGGGITGAGAMIGGAFGGGLAGAGGLISAGNFGGLISGAGSLFGSGNIAAGLGMSLPVISAAVVGAMGINKLAGGGLFGTSYKTDAQTLGLSVSGGDISGLITTEESKKKSLFRGTKRRTSTSAFDTSAIDDAFDEITMAIGAAANTFGIVGADEIIKGFTASANINIKDKSQAEIEAAIQEWIGNTSSALVGAVFGDSLAGLQKEGEGAIDTVNRLSMNMSAVQSISKTLGLGFDLTGREAMIASTNIVELAGGIGQLSLLTGQYYASFYTEAEQQQNLATQLAAEFEKLNITMPTTREGFRGIVDGLDLTTESGQAAFAALMQLVPGMDQYLSALEAQRTASEQAAEAAQKEAEAKAAALKAQGLDLQIRLYEALGQSSEALALRRQMELEATDETLRAMLLQIYAAQDATAAQLELAQAQEKAADAARDAAQSAFGKLQDAAQREKDRLATELDLKLETIDKEREALTAQRDSVIAGYEAQGQAVQNYISQLEGVTDVINNFITGTGSGVDNPFKRLEQILNETKAGLTPDQGELQSVLGAISSTGSGGFASATDQQRAMAIARSQASGIGGIVGNRLSGARSQADLIAMQIEDANKFYADELLKLDEAAALAQKLHDEQVSLIDQQLSDAEKQLNALLGVDDRILSMNDALAEFYASLESATAIQISKQDEQIAATYAVAAAVTDAAGYWVGPEQMAKPDAPMNTDNVGAPVTEDMITLLKEIVATSKANADHASKSASMLQEMTVGGLDVRVEA